MVNNHKFQQKHAKKSFNILNGLFLSVLQFNFSKKHNALYNLDDFLKRLFVMCTYNQYAETEYNSRFIKNEWDLDYRMPSGKWVLNMIKQPRYAYLLPRCRRMITRTVRRMKKHGMLNLPVDVAIDKHLIGRFDKHPNMINTIFSKFKNGTFCFNGLATINCTLKGTRACLGAVIVKRIDSLEDIVCRLVDECTRNGVRIRILAMDREFFTVNVINVLKSLNIWYITPAKRTKGVKTAIKEFKAGKRDAISSHFITSGYDKTEAEFTLIIKEKLDKKGKKVIHIFATNIPVDTAREFECGDKVGVEAFAEQYKNRWSIETGYRCIEDIRPKTTSRNESVRAMLLFMPIFLFNAWILATYLLQDVVNKSSNAVLKLKMLLDFFVVFAQAERYRLVP